jgi:HD-GYP domain-containing protein (c-di-GMP phosphodiesterase class II)
MPDGSAYPLPGGATGYMAGTKRISIAALKPGMFVVGMDQPWYKTPFLFHKRLVSSEEDVNLLRRHGIQEVLIDPSKGLDLEDPVPVPPVPDQPASPPSILSPKSDAPALSEADLARARAKAARATYGEAMKALERALDELETGNPAAVINLRKVVSDVLRRIMDHPLSMLTQFCVQKMQEFDRTLASHATDVCVLSLIVAQEMTGVHMDHEELGIGALLHDAGYLRLPRNLYRKSRELGGHERSLMQQHPQLAAAVLAQGSACAVTEHVRRVITEHHERLDGSGFPQGLSGDALSMGGQLVGLVDTYDGMVSWRTDRPPLLPHDAIRQLFVLGEKGRFDKSLVEVTIKALGVYPVGSLIKLNTGERAIVIGIHPEHRLKPTVKIITGPQGQSYDEPIVLDLANPGSDQPARTILRALDPRHEQVKTAEYFEAACEGTPR